MSPNAPLGLWVGTYACCRLRSDFKRFADGGTLWKEADFRLLIFPGPSGGFSASVISA